MLDEFTARNNESLTTLLEEHSTKLRPLPDDVMDVLHSNAVIALEELKKDDPMAQKISASYEAFLDGVRTYHEISSAPTLMPEIACYRLSHLLTSNRSRTFRVIDGDIDELALGHLNWLAIVLGVDPHLDEHTH